MIIGLALLLFLTGCAYDALRSDLRRKCAAMPQSKAEQCYRRTQDTGAEYRAKREELKRSVEGKEQAGKAADSRYDEWIP
jgi:hypothetical protein